ncbi:hypothetical protein Psfp_04141 [Pelotomaculum sp. FP]|uniref:DUF6809 family protein n=1 Tax=Pelotomaculum sp. FP TaxID=261474 RepID=UPI001064E836|nr:DUF6809 family protein [Pelotomaculum sp. FP]TEB10603.1 hypothetical protein Psfp_04141 [Pelotomaculum sp. FP]
MLKIMEKIIDARCDEIGMTVAEDEEFMKRFDDVLDAQKSINDKLPPEDRNLVDRLEEAQATLMGMVERKYYLAGLQDGTSLKQLFTREGVLDVAS